MTGAIRRLAQVADNLIGDACRALERAEIRVDRAARAVERIAGSEETVEALVNSLAPPPTPVAIVDSGTAKK